MSTSDPRTVGGVLRWVARHPWAALGRRWNYKAAVLSAAVRAVLFYVVNSAASPEAAASAMAVEFVFRFATSGFYGALTQAFRHVEPARHGTLAALVLLPFVSHSLELLVHWLNGTARLGTSLAVSVSFTALSTAFNLFAMRAGALVVGEGQRSLVADLASMPRVVALFAVAIVRGCLQIWR